MDFQLTPEQEMFRKEVRDFLDSNWQPRDLIWAYGSEEGDGIEQSREFEKKLAARGWLTMAWPKEYGGRDADAITQLIFREETSLVGAPGSSMGASMIGPCIMVHGSDEQKEEFLPPISRGEVHWCQGFSEPGAGSDLAGLQTRAVRDGDAYVINGSKIWTSGANHADWIHVLTRSDPDAPKHRGISYFLVDMRTPGINPVPITQITGGTGFCQTFFEDVRVPRKNMIGEENRGWYYATTTLEHERSNIGRLVTAKQNIDRVTQYVQEPNSDGRRLADIPRVAAGLADLAIRAEVGRWLAYRVAWVQSEGRPVSYEPPMSKMYSSDLLQRAANFIINMMGLHGQLDAGTASAPLGGFAAKSYVGTICATISAGSNEIQRNVIATRGLGLPRG